ncbi:unnamed protein product [Phytophthora lilii]|uniref:Unnamed protein product n=1 Tax=Phytophthora lilii TaxID=2077276 RepID=A0A9W6XIU0_9STRA|nr:unnamed protein product [Phytophthora lilii]
MGCAGIVVCRLVAGGGASAATAYGALDRLEIDVLREVLGEASSDIPAYLVEQNEARPLIPSLKNVLVSPRGIQCYLDEYSYPSAWVSVCKECNASIRRRKLPKFAIANGFFVGALPDYLKKFTIPERMLTQLSSIAATTRVMRGGHHRCIRSRCLVFDCTPGQPVSLLSRSLEDVTSYGVVMVGEGQMRKVRKMHRIQNGMVRDGISFYKYYNKLYDDVMVNDDVLSVDYSDDLIHDQFLEYTEDCNGELNDAMDDEQQNIRGHSDAWRVIRDDDEDSAIERRVGLTEDSPLPPLTRDLLSVAEVEGGPDAERVFLNRRSDHLSFDVSGDLFAKRFPHLFPFGRGHPGENRRVPVSVKACVKYYIELSGRQFAEDEQFTLVVFDRISVQNMFIHNCVRCKPFPRMCEGYESIGIDQLGNALLTNERRRQELSELGVKVTNRLNLWRSQQSLESCLQWDRSLQFAASIPFDILDARMPTKAELREATLGNDCASTRLFMRNVDAFIRCVLGINPTIKRPTRHRGLFGAVEAYCGMVETQGRGALHIHFLI